MMYRQRIDITKLGVRYRVTLQLLNTQGVLRYGFMKPFKELVSQYLKTTSTTNTVFGRTGVNHA
jgi:hypothetical protein